VFRFFPFLDFCNLVSLFWGGMHLTSKNSNMSDMLIHSVQNFSLFAVQYLFESAVPPHFLTLSQHNITFANTAAFSQNLHLVKLQYMQSASSKPAVASSQSSNSTPRQKLFTPLAAILVVCSALMRKLGLSLKRKRAAVVEKQQQHSTASVRDINMSDVVSDGRPAVPPTLAHIVNQNGVVISASPEAAKARAEADYKSRRKLLISDDLNESWDAPARRRAKDNEIWAKEIIQLIRENERVGLFGNVASEAIPAPTTRDMGGQFLTNKDRIEKSKIFDIAKNMPKGAHLHLHFNAELEPDILIEKAIDNPHMFIRSTQPILVDKDFDDTEVVFSVMPATTELANIFSVDYKPAFRPKDSTKPWMKWSDFRSEYARQRGNQTGRPKKAEDWIKEKLIITEDEAYGVSQSCNGIWARFNQATRCFKGLLNYESVYRWYIRNAIEHMILDRVMYAELRPMLMDKSIPTDDGTREIGHAEQMLILLEEVELVQKRLHADGKFNQFPFGFKIIYCAPRSIPLSMMKTEIADCIKLKREFPNLICGFDLVGAEDRPNHIGYYADLLIDMQETCRRDNLDIPFMFHAGETLLDTGGGSDPANSNLYDAVLLNAKRIGHGFSLLKHPTLVKAFKERKPKPICIELCPTSNELLHLCRNIKEHPYPEILAAGIPCTVNSDNPSLFRYDIRHLNAIRHDLTSGSNNVSYEFYQIMVGSPTMNIHGWRQLAEWSIEYSCLNEADQATAVRIFEADWDAFCTWIIDTYGAHATALKASSIKA
jgi:adenosine deaminase CECR1